MIEMENVVDISKKFKHDMGYITNDLIATNNNRDFVKWSRALNAVSAIGFSKEQYKGYWEGQYKKYPEYMTLILNACDDLFNNHLVNKDKMIEMIVTSNDYHTEKERAIKELGGIYVK